MIVAYETDKFSPPKANINLPDNIKKKEFGEEKLPFYIIYREVIPANVPENAHNNYPIVIKHVNIITAIRAPILSTKKPPNNGKIIFGRE